MIFPDQSPTATATATAACRRHAGHGSAIRRAGALRIAVLDLTLEPDATLRNLALLLPGGGEAPSLTAVRPAGAWPCGGRAPIPAPGSLTPAEAYEQRFDALIATAVRFDGGAHRFVAAWRELTGLFDWVESQGLPSLFVGTAARSVLYHRHTVRATALPRALGGLFPQQVLEPASPYLGGLGQGFPLAVCRSWWLQPEDLAGRQGLGVLARSEQSGLCLIEEPATQSLMLLEQLPSAPEPFPGAPQWSWQLSVRRLLANWLALAGHAQVAA